MASRMQLHALTAEFGQSRSVSTYAGQCRVSATTDSGKR